MDNNRFDDITRKLASRDSRRHFLGAICTAAGGALGLLRVSKGLARPAGTVGVCHIDDEGVYRYIQVSENAIPAHVSHGDIIAPDFLTDPANCGGCGVTCPPAPANASATCVDGECGFTCNDGYANCDGICMDTAGDVNNCGECTYTCSPAPDNATATCVGGKCGFACNDGFTECNGTCLDLSNDASNCGGCGNVCTGGQECIDGACHLPSGAKCFTSAMCETCVDGYTCMCAECTCI